MKKGAFLTFEGTDGTGKSTQARLLAQFLKKKGYSVVLTREPGGGPLAEKIRKLLLDPKNHISPMAELFLYQASRAEHVSKVIRPALKQGRVVICDRFTDATIAYQTFGRGLPRKTVEFFNREATGNLEPALTFLLDRDPSESLKNALNRGKRKGGDRLEKEGSAFMGKVRKGYLSCARRHPRRIRKITVLERPQDTQNTIRKVVEKKLRLK